MQRLGISTRQLSQYRRIRVRLDNRPRVSCARIRIRTRPRLGPLLIGSFGHGARREAAVKYRRLSGVNVIDLDMHRGYSTLMGETHNDNARPEAVDVYGSMDMPWARLVVWIAHAYGKQTTGGKGIWLQKVFFALRTTGGCNVL